MPSASPVPHRPPTRLLRVAVVAVLLLTAAAVGLLLLRAGSALGREQLGWVDVLRSDAGGPTTAVLAPAVVTLLAGVALAAVVEGLARVAGRPVGQPSPSPPADPGLARAVAELRAAVAEMHAPPPVATEEPAGPPPVEYEPVPAEPVVADPYLIHFEQMVHLLEDLRELTMLDEAGRRARGHAAKERRKSTRLTEADGLIARQLWGEAEALLTLLDSLHPGDGDVAVRRLTLDDARALHRDAEWEQLVRHAEDLMALHRYAEAAAAVRAFREQYPAHDDAAGLGAMVAAEHEAHVEAGVTALFAEIKTAVDGRQWRMALDGCQRFLSKYPVHDRADRIRQQIPTVQRNAAIEERHEQEDRIRDLAKTGQFAEAAGLCQDLLDRFPNSPRAESLSKLLPRLLERSAALAGAGAD